MRLLLSQNCPQYCYIGVSKNTVIAWMKKYNKEKFEYDPRNIYSVFNFLIYALIQKHAPLLDFLKFLLHRKFETVVKPPGLSSPCLME